MTLLSQPHHLSGKTWAGGAVIGLTWHERSCASCHIPSLHSPENHVLHPGPHRASLSGPGRVHSPTRAVAGVTRDGKGWNAMRRDGPQWSPPRQTQGTPDPIFPWEAPSMVVGLHPDQLSARRHQGVQAGPQDTSRHRVQFEHGRAASGRGGGRGEQGFTGAASKAVCAQDFPWLARVPRGLGLGQRSRLGACGG